MIVELNDYKWQYENEVVILIDKKNKKEFTLPISKTNSVSRAFISFRERFRIEQVQKIRDRFRKKAK